MKSPIVALETLWENHVYKFGLHDPDDIIRMTLLEPGIQRIFAKYAKHIHKIFRRYTSRTKSERRESMVLAQFHTFLLHCDVVGSKLSRAEATTIFVLTQEKSHNQCEDLVEIDYSEFQECLGRIAMVMKQEHKKFSNKVKGLLKTLTAMSKR